MLVPLHGFSMALADSVPGVSGGTIAFIFGFYDKFINSLHDIVGKDKQKRKDAFIYLILFALGWGITFALCTVVLGALFDTYVHVLCSVFLGLTAVAIPIIVLEEKESIKGKYFNIVFLILGIALVVGLMLLPFDWTIDFKNLEIWQYFFLFGVGMLGISAMVLPGISGSTVLLIFGVYMPAMKAIKDFLKAFVLFDWTTVLALLPGILCLGGGIIFGLLVSSRFISFALKKNRSAMVYFILGLMFGSMVAIIAGPTTLTPWQAPLGDKTFNAVGFVVGAVVLIGLELLKRLLEKKRKGKKDANKENC